MIQREDLERGGVQGGGQEGRPWEGEGGKRRERGGVWGRVIREEKKTVLELVGEK